MNGEQLEGVNLKKGAMNLTINNLIRLHHDPVGHVRNIYMAPRLSGQNCNFFKFLLSHNF